MTTQLAHPCDHRCLHMRACCEWSSLSGRAAAEASTTDSVEVAPGTYRSLRDEGLDVARVEKLRSGAVRLFVVLSQREARRLASGGIDVKVVRNEFGLDRGSGGRTAALHGLRGLARLRRPRRRRRVPAPGRPEQPAARQAREARRDPTRAVRSTRLGLQPPGSARIKDGKRPAVLFSASSTPASGSPARSTVRLLKWYLAR